MTEIEISNFKEFEEELKEHNEDIVVVCFDVKWGENKDYSGPLKKLTEQFEEVVVFKVDLESGDMKSHFEIAAVPTFFVYENGKKAVEKGIVGNMEEVEKVVSETKKRLDEKNIEVMKLLSQEPVKIKDEPKKEEEKKKEEEEKKEAAVPTPKSGKISPEEAMKLVEGQCNSQFVQELVGMGYSKLHSLKALVNTGNKSLNQAVEWLVTNQSNPELDTPFEVTIKPDETPEEKEKRIEKEKNEMKELINLKKELDLKKQKKRKKKSELKRREEGKKMKEIREQFEKEKRKREWEEKRAEKRKDKEERRRMKKLLKMDKIRRKIDRLREKGDMEGVRKLEQKNAKLLGIKLEQAPKKETKITNTTVAVEEKKEEKSTKVEIHVRLLDGGRKSNFFEPTQKIEDVYNWVKTIQNKKFSLMTTFPRKIFKGAELRKTLKDAGLGNGGMLTSTPN